MDMRSLETLVADAEQEQDDDEAEGNAQQP
jgi:hypothetical protein